MSYLKRRRHRNCANFILENLHRKSPDHDLFLSKEDWYDPNIPALRMKEIHEMTEKYSLSELKRAARLLMKNGYVNMVNAGTPTNPSDEATLILIIEGKDAFLDDFYKKANRKDLLESIELSTRWLLPILSILISLMAYFKR